MSRRAGVCARRFVVLWALLVVSGCAGPAPREVIVYTSVDQVFSEPVLLACGERTGLEVRGVFDTEETKSTGILNRLLAEAEHPRADVFWSGDAVRPFVLIRRGLVEPYVSPAAAAFPAALRAADGTWTGLGARARVLLVNTRRVSESERPDALEDLADPRWRGQVAIANPLYGTTTTHAAALFTAWGEARARDFFERLRANEVRIAGSNGEVQRLVVAGEVAFGLTDTDDAYAAVAAGHPVAVVYPDQHGEGTLVMPTAVALVRGGPNPAAARRLIDCLLSAASEQRLVADGSHFPLRADVAPPPGAVPITGLVAFEVDRGELAATLERIQPWLRDWVGV